MSRGVHGTCSVLRDLNSVIATARSTSHKSGICKESLFFSGTLDTLSMKNDATMNTKYYLVTVNVLILVHSFAKHFKSHSCLLF